ncbi:ScyD/ScyE family protein [Gramella sp. KN1008]|uniref:ScyD/ScyE family protein n=1 Tax=Gramella sp. KN1008 TaxID=2529298 RepID=UPI0013F17B1C|nr:ScyD/ScyE family protein [Gramella sp. KN1008]
MKLAILKSFYVALLLCLFTACEKEIDNLNLETFDLSMKKNQSVGTFEFPDAEVFDISATADGSIMVGLNTGNGRSIQLIKNGEIRTLHEVETNTNIQGIQAIGTGNAFFTTGGSNLAEDGELYRISNGKVRMVADLGEFEKANDPDAFEGIQWKYQLCEEEGVFSAGPQNNPFKVTTLDGGTALIGDAAGNTILQATTTGHIDWKAILTPPLDENGEFMVLFEHDGLTCYVQPVATSVAVGPDGYVYAGELTGAVPQTSLTPEGLPKGLSRVWRFPADATNLVCSELEGSENCYLFLDGLTSIIDLEFGPDGLLYVVEFDENSWAGLSNPSGGTVSAYNLEGELIKKAEGLMLPSAITFDKKGNLWLLENNIFAPTVRILDPGEFTHEGS